MSEKISVVVPVYNVEKYVRDCINAIRNQTYTNLEIILVDDGSEDSSGKICDEYAAIDNRIRVIHKTNGGMSDARNAGIEIATGEWFVFIDSDDFVHLRMIEVLYHTAKKYEVSMVWCDFVQSDEGGTLLEQPDEKILTEEKYEVQVLSKQEAEMQFYTIGRMSECMVPWNKIYKREIIGYGEDAIRYPVGKVFEDGFTTYRFIYRADKVVLVRFPLYYYRQRGGSIMRENGNRNYLPVMESGVERLEFYKKHNERELYLKEVNSILYSTIRLYENHKKTEDRKKLKEWYKKFYYDYFKAEKWPLAKRIRLKAFLMGYPFYWILSKFQGIYNKISGNEI